MMNASKQVQPCSVHAPGASIFEKLPYEILLRVIEAQQSPFEIWRLRRISQAFKQICEFAFFKQVKTSTTITLMLGFYPTDLIVDDEDADDDVNMRNVVDDVDIDADVDQEVNIRLRAVEFTESGDYLFYPFGFEIDGASGASDGSFRFLASRAEILGSAPVTLSCYSFKMGGSESYYKCFDRDEVFEPNGRFQMTLAKRRAGEGELASSISSMSSAAAAEDQQYTGTGYWMGIEFIIEYELLGVRELAPQESYEIHGRIQSFRVTSSFIIRNIIENSEDGSWKALRRNKHRESSAADGPAENDEILTYLLAQCVSPAVTFVEPRCIFPEKLEALRQFARSQGLAYFSIHRADVRGWLSVETSHDGGQFSTLVRRVSPRQLDMRQLVEKLKKEYTRLKLLKKIACDAHGIPECFINERDCDVAKWMARNSEDMKGVLRKLSQKYPKYPQLMSTRS